MDIRSVKIRTVPNSHNIGEVRFADLELVRNGSVTMEFTTYDLGFPVILTSITATKPSDEFMPFTATDKLWLMPILVFGSRPVTYVMLLWYV